MQDVSIYEDSVEPIRVGQISDKGLKDHNEDSLGFFIPDDTGCFHKGIVAVIADGVSSEEAGKQASEICVKNFLSDYFATPDSWTVKASAQRILTAMNRWLYSQSVGGYALSQGYISTMTAIVLHADLVHVFHIGNSRVYRLRDHHLELLTRDHRRQVSDNSRYLTRAMGMDVNLELDYFCASLEAGDTFLLSTDGVHDFIPDSDIRQIILCELSSQRPDLHACCEQLIARALESGSDDNLSCQLVQFNTMPYLMKDALAQRANGTNLHLNFLNLPFLGSLEKSETVDGLWVVDVLGRKALFSEYLVKDLVSNTFFIMRAPVKSLEHDMQFKSHFVLEPWAANIVKHPQILSYPFDNKYKHFFYFLREYDACSTLKGWMESRSQLYLETCLEITHQLLDIVQLLHQKDILLLNLSAENILIDASGRIKLFDFSACYIQGMPETRISAYRNKLATAYAAPEFLCDDKPTMETDIFSISVIAYSLMTGSLPYGESYFQCATLQDYYKLRYQRAFDKNTMIPDWLESVLMKGLSLSARQRFANVEEMRLALTSPQNNVKSQSQTRTTQTALLKTVSVILVLTQAALLVWFLG